MCSVFLMLVRIPRECVMLEPVYNRFFFYVFDFLYQQLAVLFD